MVTRQQGTLNFLLIFSYMVIILGIFAALFAQPIGQNNVLLDDAYMFVRYADNLLQHGQLAWNPQGPATFGLTSMLFWVTLVVPIRYFVESASATALLASFLSGCLFLALLIMMVIQQTTAGPFGKRLLALIMLLVVTAPRTAITTHFLLGMDTLFALASLTLYIMLSKWYERAGSRTSLYAVGIAGGLLGTVRPDLLLYSLLVPLSIIFFAQTRKSRWAGISILTVTVGLLLLLIGAATYYLNSPLPLPFYAKGLNAYGETFYQIHKFDAVVHAKEFIEYHRLLLAMLAIGIFSHYKQWWQRLTPVDRGLLGAALLFFFYFLFFVTPVTGRAARFNYPLLPVIVFLGVRTVALYANKLAVYPQTIRAEVLRCPPLCAFLVVVMLLTPYLYQCKALGQAPRYSFDVQTHYTASAEARYYWFALDKIAELPADLTMATTEIGLVSALNPDKTIIDLSGLNDSDIAHHGFSAERLIQMHDLDLIYLPHPHYREMVTEILNNKRFQQEYTYFSAQQLDALMGIALHKKSKYYASLLEIVNNAQP